MALPRPPKRQKTSSSSIPDTINNFTLLPIAFPSSLPSIPSATHILYLRRHEEPPVPPAITSTVPSRTLFVVNVPVDSTKELLRALFASFGARAEDVKFKSQEENDTEEEARLPYTWDKRLCSTGETAHVTFPEAGDIDRILKTIGKLRRSNVGAIATWEEGVTNPPVLGFQRYLTHHKLLYPPKQTLQSLVDTSLTTFNAATAARMLTLKRLRSEPDEEGFITVTRKEKPDDLLRAEERRGVKNKAVDLEDFYRFQRREKRDVKMRELRERFEADRRKIEKAKEARKFKPF